MIFRQITSNLLRGDRMLVLKESPQTQIYETLLPSELCKLNDELSKVSAPFGQRRFSRSIYRRFKTTIGRPTVPVQTYLRIMYLKYRHRLGYEVL
jgi:IS5 family transposase